MDNRQPYTTPTLTRVVLEPVQAVLSVCSTYASNLADGGSNTCTFYPLVGADCSKWSGSVTCPGGGGGGGQEACDTSSAGS